MVQLRLTNQELTTDPFGPEFDGVFRDRLHEADDFYTTLSPATLGPQQIMISRQAYAGECTRQMLLYYILEVHCHGFRKTFVLHCFS